MKTKNILIATGLILILGTFLNGCQLAEKIGLELPESISGEKATAKKPRLPKPHVEALVQKAAAAKKEVEMVLKAEKEGAEIKVKITLSNPNQKPVTSVQSWLSFNPAKLQGASIDTSATAFSLMAPYDNTFDNEEGLVMLGRANPESITEKEIVVAEVVFDIAESGTTMIDTYDYRDDLTGHTSVNTVIDGKPYNILIKPESPALIIEN